FSVISAEIACHTNAGDAIERTTTEHTTTGCSTTEETLRQERDRAQSYLDIAEVIIQHLDSSGNVILVNRKVCSLLGYREEEIVGKNWFDNFVPERMRRRMKTAFDGFMAANTEAAEFLENSLVTRSGTERVIAWHHVPVRDNDGNITACLASGLDITERRRTEEELRKSEERFRQVAESAGEWIWEVDADGLYTYVSPVIEQVLGYTPEEVVGKKHFYDFFVPGEREEMKRAALEAFARKESLSKFPNANVHKNGNSVWLETSGVPVLDEDGNLLKYRGADTDITERKLSELALRERTYCLQERINELRCLHKVTRLTANVCEPLENVVQAAAEAMREAWQYPDITCARIALGRREYATPNWRETDWTQSAAIVTNEDRVGTVAVAYLEERPVADEGPFLKEERELIEGIARLLGDFIQRRRAEVAVRKERDRAQQYLDIAGTIFVAINAGGVVTLINQKGCEVLGYREQEIVGENWFDNFIPLQLREELMPISRQLLSGEMEAAEYHENPILTKSGQERVIAWHNTVLRDEEGRIVGHLSSGEDITERKRVEERLLRLSNAVRASTDSVVTCGLDGKIVDVNDATLRMYGTDNSADLIGMHTAELICLEDRDRALAGFGEALNKGFVKNAEYELIVRDGSRIPVEISASLMRDDAGNPLGFVGITRDITERKRSQEALARQAEALARMNTQLECANTELMELDRMKSDFLSNVSHELRTPLTAVRAYAETLMDYSSIPEEQRGSFLSIIIRQSERLSAVIEDLLDLSKIEAGKPKLSPAPHQIKKTVEAAMQTIVPMAQSKSIEVRVEPSNQDECVLADEQRVIQVLVNLLANAVKFTDPGGVIELSATLAGDSKGGHADAGVEPSHARITVSDNGEGIPAEELARVFEKFRQVAGIAKGKPAGTGLGLAICKELVENMKGRIWVESTVGEGSRFHFTLPLAAPAHAITDPPETCGSS
ncbi:MAG: PAS domain-containing sensor histidine kinase, partial [Candidatus Eisenbacteria bacterium]